MSDDRVIGYLRSRAQVEPDSDLVARIMAAVDATPSTRSPFATFLPAAAIAGAVAVVIALAVILGQGPNIGPDPTGSPEAAPSPVPIEDLRAAVESGIDVLREAPGVEGIGTSSILGELSSATWFRWRPSGDQVVVLRSDVDVSQTAWWLEPEGEPPARGENITTTIHVLLSDEYLMADDEAWVIQAGEAAPPTFTMATGMLDGDALAIEGFIGQLTGDATVTSGGDGSTTWTLSAPYRDGSAISEWRISPDGALVSWSSELVDVTPTLEDAPFVTFHQMEFRPLTRTAVILRPDTDAAPDAEALGLPPDFPMESDAQEDDPTPGSTASAASRDLVHNDEGCQHTSGAYAATLPDGWWTNVAFEHPELGQIAACRFFAPERFDPLSATRDDSIPVGVALSLDFINGGCTGHFTAILAEREAMVDGYPASVREYAQRPASGSPPGTYEYVVTVTAGAECDDQLVYAITRFDMSGDYKANKTVLDRLMETIRITPP